MVAQNAFSDELLSQRFSYMDPYENTYRFLAISSPKMTVIRNSVTIALKEKIGINFGFAVLLSPPLIDFAMIDKDRSTTRLRSSDYHN